MEKIVRLLAVLGLAAQMLAQSANDSSPVTAPGAKLEKLAGEFKFTEGPTCDQDGNVSSPINRTTAS